MKRPRAILHRIDPLQLIWGSLLLAGLVALAGVGLVTPIWSASAVTKWSRIVHTAVTALVLLGAVRVADEAVERGLRPLPTYALAIAVGSIVGSFVGWEVRGALHLNYNQVSIAPRFAWVRRIDAIIICAFVAALATFAHVSRRNALAALRRQHEAETARARAQRRTLESELQALQARIEPRFLSETLVRIRKLYRVDAASAGATLEDLIVYLRAALPHLRESSSAVGQEFLLARAWLDIVGRSEPDWALEFDLAESARAARLPALVVLPLAQHVVAKSAGGPLRLRLAAHVEAGRLRIGVLASTDAFSRGIAGQALLEQLRDRLEALYGPAARFEARARTSSHGSEASVELPAEGSTREDVEVDA